MANYLSHLESGEEGTGIQDNFPDGQLFWVNPVPVHEMNDETSDAWITEMTIFLTTGLPPDHMSIDERKRLVVRSQKFYILNNTLYHKGLMEFRGARFDNLRKKHPMRNSLWRGWWTLCRGSNSQKNME